MKFLYFLPLLAAKTLAQSSNGQCQTACMTYLNELSTVRQLNPAVWDYSGPVSAKLIQEVCASSGPGECCACGAPGVEGTAGSTNEQTILALWAITCQTLTTSGPDAAAQCWASHLQSGCNDFNGLLGGAQCGASGGGGGGASSSAAGVALSTTQPALVATNSFPNSPSSTASSVSSSNAAKSNANKTVSGGLQIILLTLALSSVGFLGGLFLLL